MPSDISMLPPEPSNTEKGMNERTATTAASTTTSAIDVPSSVAPPRRLTSRSSPGVLGHGQPPETGCYDLKSNEQFTPFSGRWYCGKGWVHFRMETARCSLGP